MSEQEFINNMKVLGYIMDGKLIPQMIGAENVYVFLVYPTAYTGPKKPQFRHHGNRESGNGNRRFPESQLYIYAPKIPPKT